MKQYRYIQHDMEDINTEMEMRANNGWTIHKAFDIKPYIDGEGFYMGILWEREKPLETITI